MHDSIACSHQRSWQPVQTLQRAISRLTSVDRTHRRYTVSSTSQCTGSIIDISAKPRASTSAPVGSLEHISVSRCRRPPYASARAIQPSRAPHGAPGRRAARPSACARPPRPPRGPPRRALPRPARRVRARRAGTRLSDAAYMASSTPALARSRPLASGAGSHPGGRQAVPRACQGAPSPPDARAQNERRG